MSTLVAERPPTPRPSPRPVPTRHRRLFIVDVVLLGLVAVTAATAGSGVHTVAGFVLIAVIALHVGLHVKWIKRAVRRDTKRRPVRDLTLDTAMAATFVPVAITGAAMAVGPELGEDLHSVAGWAFVVLAATHALLHLRFLVAVGSRLVSSRRGRPPGPGARDQRGVITTTGI